jgi:hypothetical protein
MSRYRNRVVFWLAALLAVVPGASGQTQASKSVADLVVYGGTASGVMTAYAAARQGLKVVLLVPGAHVGGMVTGGLSATDLGNFNIIGGYARQFYREAALHYGVHDLDTPEHWLSEPHVNEAIFNRMLRDSGVKVRLHERLREHGGVKKQGNRVVAVITEDGKRWAGKVFADCSYEGDLMAEVGVRYVEGRESTAAYGESLAGVRAQTPRHQFQFPVDPYDEDHHLLPEVMAGPLAKAGTGDEKVQAYNFRPILTNDPANRLPLTEPRGYDRREYALLDRYLRLFAVHTGREPTVRDVTNPVAIPNHKADFNNNGAFSTDFIGHSWTYPNASYAERARLWRQHMVYTQGFFWFLATDPSVAQSLREEMNQWGPPRDEFADTGHWPDQLYIREGRRMVGTYVMRQQDLQTERTKADSVGMGSYNSDSHNVERVAMPDGTVQNEGNVEVPVEPYEIPYRVMLPQRKEAENLLVPVCLSATHVSYSSLRMEPQYMMLGQAAGVAASLAVKRGVAVQDVAVDALQRELRAEGAILHLNEQVDAAAKKN